VSHDSQAALEPEPVDVSVDVSVDASVEASGMTRLLVGLVGLAIVIITFLTITAVLAGPPAV
jgi:hypothetical protein